MKATKNLMKFIQESSVRTLMVTWTTLENTLKNTNKVVVMENGQFIKKSA
jgi:ABC-type uncharacterized transport system ATPase component